MSKTNNIKAFLNDGRILSNIEVNELTKALIEVIDQQDKRITKLEQAIEVMLENETMKDQISDYVK